MARTKVDNKLNVVIGTKAQIEGDTGIPENSIIVVTDDSGITVASWGTTTKTLALSDSNKLFRCADIVTQTLTIPTNSTVPFPVGTMITFLLTGTNTITFVGASGVTLTSMGGLVELKTQYAMARLIKTNTNIWHLVNDSATLGNIDAILDSILGV